MKHIAVFFGTRPEGIKMSPVIAALSREPNYKTTVVSTGQHREMLHQVIDLFGIHVDRDLKIMRPDQSLAELTARLMITIDKTLEELKPDLVLVQGDTTTVLIAALASFYRRIPVGHVEAGLRTGNVWSPFPEEVNRTLASRIVTLHFAPTQTSRQNLLREGVSDSIIAVTGNTVIDALQLEVKQQQQPEVRTVLDDDLSRRAGEDWNRVPFVLITGHRRENFGSGFGQICRAIKELAQRFADHRFIYPVHLNPNVQKPVHEMLDSMKNVKLIEPLDYRLFVALMNQCRLVLTDSGGVQEEAPGLGKPVLVMRDTTERPEAVEAGTVKLVGANAQRIIDEVSRLLTDANAYRQMAEAVNPYGDGKAAGRIVQRIHAYFADTART